MTTETLREARAAEPHHPGKLPLLHGILPLDRSTIGADVLAGVTLAALGIPEVLGYAKIAGMPVVTGLYTILVPLAAFALVGSSRHLVVGADSATAAILAAGLAGVAAPGSPRYLGLAALSALVTGALLLVARLVRLGFLANFLSRTVLIGFLTGVGVQVALGQVGEMLGLPSVQGGAIHRVVGLVKSLGHVHPATVLVSAAVIATVLATRKITRSIPGALVAVVGAIVVSRLAHLGDRGVALLGAVPSGLPRLALPALDGEAVRAVMGPALSMFLVVLAQSSATSRAYAARYDEVFDENEDLVGLAAANTAAAFTGAFVVNGSPTKTQMVDGAGGRSQVAQLTTAALVLVVLLFLTGPLASLPTAVLASVVFLIGVELVDLRGLAGIARVRRDELLVAVVTALAVVFIGVEQGIVLAVVASVVDHLRHSYAPRNSVLVQGEGGRLRTEPAGPDERTRPGLVIYRFGSSLYYANAQRLHHDLVAFADRQPDLAWLVLDFVAIGDVDFTAAATLRRTRALLSSRGIRLAFTQVPAAVRSQLDAYGISEHVGDEDFFEGPVEVLAAFDGRPPRRQNANAPAGGPGRASTSGVARAGFEPTTFGL